MRPAVVIIRLVQIMQLTLYVNTALGGVYGWLLGVFCVVILGAPEAWTQCQWRNPKKQRWNMLPAEIQRVVLLICLAATGYLLILAWNEDMQGSRDQDFYAAEPQIMATEPVADASFNEDSDTPTLAVSDSDIPAISSLDVASVEPINALATVTGDRLVTVTTPSLKIWIDRKGGDVVRVLLPKFPMEIDRPDVPFVLLDQSQQRTYIAQSGLIGADGTDSNGERPLYSADKSNFEISQGEIEVVLRADVAGNPVEKIFRFRADDYLVDVEYRVINNKGARLLPVCLLK